MHGHCWLVWFWLDHKGTKEHGQFWSLDWHGWLWLCKLKKIRMMPSLTTNGVISQINNCVNILLKDISLAPWKSVVSLDYNFLTTIVYGSIVEPWPQASTRRWKNSLMPLMAGECDHFVSVFKMEPGCGQMLELLSDFETLTLWPRFLALITQVSSLHHQENLAISFHRGHSSIS